MAASDKSIHNFTNGTLTDSSLFVMAYPSPGVGFATGKISAAELGAGICTKIDFNNLNTENKKIFQAINELLAISTQAGAAIAATLEAGQTQLIINNAEIHENSIIDYYAWDVYNAEYNSVEVEEGSLTMIFDARAADLDILILLRGVAETND